MYVDTYLYTALKMRSGEYTYTYKYLPIINSAVYNIYIINKKKKIDR